MLLCRTSENVVEETESYTEGLNKPNKLYSHKEEDNNLVL